jgi:hypothetical protein
MSHRRLMPSALVGLAFFILGASDAGAQQRITLANGDRIRVDWRDLGTSSADGRYVEGAADSLIFTTREGVRLAVPRRSVTRLQVALGQRNRGREFAIGGVVVGAAVGVALGVASAGEKQETLTGSSYPTLGDPTTSGILGGLAGGLAGAFIGTWLGRTRTTDRWQDVNLSSFNVSMGVKFRH